MNPWSQANEFAMFSAFVSRRFKSAANGCVACGIHSVESLCYAVPMDIHVDELAKHAGNWIAVSPDGSRILDSCESLAELRQRLAAVHVDLEAVVFQRVPSRNMIISGSELS